MSLPQSVNAPFLIVLIFEGIYKEVKLGQFLTASLAIELIDSGNSILFKLGQLLKVLPNKAEKVL